MPTLATTVDGLKLPNPFIIGSGAKLGNSDRPALMNAMLLYTQSALFGVFASQNAFLFYIFYELSLVPVFFLLPISVAFQDRPLMTAAIGTLTATGCPLLARATALIIAVQLASHGRNSSGDSSGSKYVWMMSRVFRWIMSETVICLGKHGLITVL